MAKKEVEEEVSTLGDNDNPIVISDSPEKKRGVRYEGCGPTILKFRIGAKRNFKVTAKLQIPQLKRPHSSVASASSTTPQFHDGNKETPLFLDCKTVVFFANASDAVNSNERSGASVETARENGERR